MMYPTQPRPGASALLAGLMASMTTGRGPGQQMLQSATSAMAWNMMKSRKMLADDYVHRERQKNYDFMKYMHVTKLALTCSTLVKSFLEEDFSACTEDWNSKKCDVAHFRLLLNIL